MQQSRRKLRRIGVLPYESAEGFSAYFQWLGIVSSLASEVSEQVMQSVADEPGSVNPDNLDELGIDELFEQLLGVVQVLAEQDGEFQAGKSELIRPSI